MRPTRTASPLSKFSPQSPGTWLSSGSCANILGPFQARFTKIRLDIYPSILKILRAAVFVCGPLHFALGRDKIIIIIIIITLQTSGCPE